MARVVTLGEDIPTIQITSGSAQVMLEEPVEDHPVGVGVEGVTTLSKPLVVRLLAAPGLESIGRQGCRGRGPTSQSGRSFYRSLHVDRTCGLCWRDSSQTALSGSVEETSLSVFSLLCRSIIQNHWRCIVFQRPILGIAHKVQGT
eukprot:2466441-Amphidinium_carterae.1